jgi:hypothetical protein
VTQPASRCPSRSASTRPQVLQLVLAVCFGAGCQGAPSPHRAAAEPAHAVGSSARPEPVAEAKAASPAAREAREAAKDEPPLRVRAEGQLGPGANVLFIDIAPPEGAKLTLDSPLTVRGSGGIGLRFPSRLSGPLSSHSMPLRLPIDVSDGATGPARVEVTYYWCSDGNEAACRREQAALDVELDLTGAGAGGEAHLSYTATGNRS